MGYIRHNAIIVTSWSDKAIEGATVEAARLGLITAGPVKAPFNFYQTLLVAPDGSKEWWAPSNEFDERRNQFVEWLDSQRHEDGSSSLNWVEVAYGSDDRNAEIIRHTWNTPGWERTATEREMTV